MELGIVFIRLWSFKPKLLLEEQVSQFLVELLIFKCFALEHNAFKAKHLSSVLRHVLRLDFVDILQL